MRSLEERVARLIDPQAWETYDYVAAAPHGNEEPARRYTALSKSKARDILALIRDRLLSEDAVAAGYDATRLPDGTPQFADAGFCLGHAAKILLAAMDRIEATQPVSGEVADG